MEWFCKQAVARQWTSIRHVMATADTQGTEELLLEAVFSTRYLLTLNKESIFVRQLLLDEQQISYDIYSFQLTMCSNFPIHK
jgi:hypothetical protein